MGIAFSNTKIVWRADLDGSAAASLLADLHSVFTEVLWAATPVAGGWKYQLTSPQGLLAKVQATVISNTRLDLQFMSADETRLGVIHHLFCAAGRVFQVVANRCQAFISRPGVGASSTFNTGNTLAGGIPFVPRFLVQDCVDEGIPAAEAWWSCGDVMSNDLYATATFRVGYHLGTWTTFDACWNGNLMMSHTPGFPGSNPGNLRIVPWMMPKTWPGFFNPPPRTRWFGGIPMHLDPLLAWGQGNVNTSLARLRGQVWDAMWVSCDQPLDLLETEGEGESAIKWINFSHLDSGYGGTYCGCLYLIREPVKVPAAGVWSYAY